MSQYPPNQPPPVNSNGSSKFGSWWATQSPKQRLAYYGVIFIIVIGFLSIVDRVPQRRRSKSPEAKVSTSPEIKVTPIPSNTPPPPPVAEPIAKRISKQELGQDYPFTISEGFISCVNSAVLFTTGGQIYAVNGTAKSLKRYKPIDEIWADDPKIKGAKINIGKVIQMGLELCR